MNYPADIQRTAVVIEDDADIRQLLEAVLAQAGFDTVAASNGRDGLAAVIKHNPTVTTLDVSMPGMDGFETARRIRAASASYIVMITGRDDEFDTLQGLQAGADHYIAKPFRPRELRARIEAMLSRPRGGPESPPVSADTWPRPLHRGAGAGASQITILPARSDLLVSETVPSGTAAATVPAVQAQAPASSPVTAPAPATSVSPPAEGLPSGEGERSTSLKHNGLELSPDTRVVTVDGNVIDLTRTEFDLLATLLGSKRRVRSKADLALLVRGESYVTSYFVGESDKRAVEAHISNLRRKLNDSSSNPRWVETVRGVGYRLAEVL